MKTFFKVLGFVLVLGLGFGIGYRYSKYQVQSKNIAIQATQNTEVSTDAKITNKFFELFNTYTMEKDMGNPTIDFAYLNEGLLLFDYPTSQETEDFGVYDYRNDVIYKNVGTIGGNDEYYNTPLSFLDRNTIITIDTGTGSARLSMIDYRTKEVKKTIPINVPQGYNIHEVDHFPMNNNINITFRNADDTSKNPTGAYLQFELNTKTLTLSKPHSPF